MHILPIRAFFAISLLGKAISGIAPSRAAISALKPLRKVVYVSQGFPEVVSTLPLPTIPSDGKVFFNLDERASLLEPLPYNRQFMGRKHADDDEGLAVLGVEGVDIITVHTHSQKKTQNVSSPSLALSPPFTEVNASRPEMPTPIIQAEDAGAAQPPLFALVSALGASLGYMIMMIMRCKSFLAELAPKQPLRQFVLASLERPLASRGSARRIKAKGSSRFNFSRGAGLTTFCASGAVGGATVATGL